MAKTNFEVVSQIQMKKCGADGRDAFKAGETVYMGRCYGEAMDVKVKTARSGDPYTYLLGEFRFINAKGEGFESSKLFLPGTILEPLEAQIKGADGAPVQFAYDIFANPDDKITVGFRYAIKQLVKAEASNRLEALAASVDEQPVPTPKKASEKKEKS